MNRNNNTRLFRSIIISRDDGRRRIGFLDLYLYRAYCDWQAIVQEEWPVVIPESRRAFTNDSSGYLARKRTIRGFRWVPGGLPRLVQASAASPTAVMICNGYNPSTPNLIHHLIPGGPLDVLDHHYRHRPL